MNRALLKYGLIFLALCLFALALTGCGEAASTTDPPAGVFVDATAEEYLRVKFEQIKECTQLPAGEFQDLAIVIMPPRFPCEHYADGCDGEYRAPSTIKLASFALWPHELIHFLLDKNTGNRDNQHRSDLFRRCG